MKTFDDGRNTVSYVGNNSGCIYDKFCAEYCFVSEAILMAPGGFLCMLYPALILRAQELIPTVAVSV